MTSTSGMRTWCYTRPRPAGASRTACTFGSVRDAGGRARARPGRGRAWPLGVEVCGLVGGAALAGRAWRPFAPVEPPWASPRLTPTLGLGTFSPLASAPANAGRSEVGSSLTSLALTFLSCPSPGFWRRFLSLHPLSPSSLQTHLPPGAAARCTLALAKFGSPSDRFSPGSPVSEEMKSNKFVGIRRRRREFL